MVSSRHSNSGGSGGPLVRLISVDLVVQHDERWKTFHNTSLKEIGEDPDHGHVGAGASCGDSGAFNSTSQTSGPNRHSRGTLQTFTFTLCVAESKIGKLLWSKPKGSSLVRL